MMTPEEYDPPTYGGTPMQEAHAEMIQIFGMEQQDRQWILTDYDVWERNPYYNGPEQQHPEDDTPHEDWLAGWREGRTKQTKAEMDHHRYMMTNPNPNREEDDCPF
jgi:hypothetical protein